MQKSINNIKFSVHTEETVHRAFFYHGIQRVLLLFTRVLTLVMLVWMAELRAEKWVSLISNSRFLLVELVQHSFLILRLQLVFRQEVHHLLNTSGEALISKEWVLCFCSCLKKQTVKSRMSAFSILDSGCFLRNSRPRRDWSCFMLLLIRMCVTSPPEAFWAAGTNRK